MRLAVIRLGTTLAFVGLAYPQGDELRRAAELDAAHKCDEAEFLYRQALAKAPSSPAVLNNVGNHYLICNQPEKAELHFAQLLKINPDHANANLQLARLAIERKQGEIALRFLSNVKESAPAILLLRAEASHYAGRHDEALKIVDALQQNADSDPPRVLFALGLTCARIGLYIKAEDAFNRVLLTRPNDFNVLLNLGRAAARAQHYDRALRALEVAVKMQPEDVDALLELGLAYAALQDYNRSVYVLAKARQRMPKRPDVLIALARAAEDAGFYGDSVVAYDEYLQIAPGDDTVRRDRAHVVGLTGTRLAEGVSGLTLYVKKHPQDAVGQYYLAQLTWKEKPEAAIEQLSTALRFDPNFAPAYFSRGWLLQRLGHVSDSLTDFKAVVRLQPNNESALDQLGLAYLSLEQPAEAEKILRRALAITPHNPEVLLHLGRSLVALDRAGEAQPYLDEFQKLRSNKPRDPRRESGMFELATMSQRERMELEIKRLREDARTHPSDPELLLHLAGLLLANGQTEEAIAAYRELLTRNADSKVWQEAGTTLLGAAHYQLAREFLERASADFPKARLDLAIALFFAEGPQQALKAMQEVPEREQDGDYLLMKARILDAAGQNAEADLVLQEGLRHPFSRADVAEQAASMLFRRNRLGEAFNILNKTSKAIPDNPDLMLGQAALLASMGRRPEAEQLLEQIESRWPEWDRAYTAHGLLLESMKRTAEAQQKLQTALALASGGVATQCALARLGGQENPNPLCACTNRLEDLVFPTCR